MEDKCWNCGKINQERQDGYFYCNCRNIKDGGGGLIYLPLEVVEIRKEINKTKNGQLFQ